MKTEKKPASSRFQEILAAAALVVWAICWSASTARGFSEPENIRSLAGLHRLSIEVDMGPSIEGLTAGKVESTVARQLAPVRGLSIVSEKDAATLRVDIKGYMFKESYERLVEIRISVLQKVSLARDPAAFIYAATWSISTLSRDAFAPDVSTLIKQGIDRFIGVYRSENPIK